MGRKSEGREEAGVRKGQRRKGMRGKSSALKYRGQRVRRWRETLHKLSVYMYVCEG